MKHVNTLQRIANVQEIMKAHYEPGNQRKSQVQVLRHTLSKTYPMSERTMRRYMKVDVAAERASRHATTDRRQLKIEF